MNNYKLAILISTFLRDNLLYKTIQSIVDNYINDSIILIADQGYADDEKDITIDYYKSQIPLEYFRIPFDSGLGYTRNYLTHIANERNIPYVLVSTDSIQFIEPYNFEHLFKDLDNTIINFKLKKVETIPLKGIFLAKTINIINLWDDEMKLFEHELALIECKKRNLEIVWNEEYNFKKTNHNSSKEYQSYYKRIRYYKKLSNLKKKKLCI